MLETARGSAGTLHVPVPHGSDIGVEHLEERAGADLLHDLPRIADWLTGLAAPLVLGNYVYADGATNMRVAMAVDTLTQELLRRRDDVALAFLATPTDVFAVPPRPSTFPRAATAAPQPACVWRAPRCGR